MLLWGTASGALSALAIGRVLLSGTGLTAAALMSAGLTSAGSTVAGRVLAGPVALPPATRQGIGINRPPAGSDDVVRAACGSTGIGGATTTGSGAAGTLTAGRVTGALAVAPPMSTQRRTATASPRAAQPAPPTPRTTLAGTASRD